jgi:hypothetical protein
MADGLVIGLIAASPMPDESRGAILPGHGNDGHGAARTRQFHDGLDAIHLRHQHVGDDQIRPNGFEQLQRLQPVARQRDGVPIDRQHLDQWLAKLQSIVNNKNIGRARLVLDGLTRALCVAQFYR